MSDQQKGLVQVIKDYLPLAEHRNCARHVYANFKKAFPGLQYKFLFWKASKCGTVQQFEQNMDEMRQYSEDAYHHCTVKQDPKQWSRAFFSMLACSDSVDNNICETFNSSIIEEREKNIIEMLEDIRLQVMARMQKKISAMAIWNTEYCLIIMQKLEKNKEDHRFWVAHYNGSNSFETRKNRYEAFIVDSTYMRCSCRMWDLSGIPCPHAISVMYYLNVDPVQHLSAWFSVAKYRETYSHVLQPLNGQNNWYRTNKPAILPPTARRMPGRPKKNRRKDGVAVGTGRVTEVTASHQLSRKGRKMHCSRCDSEEHNIRSCKSTDPPVRKKQVRKKKGEASTVPVDDATNVTPGNSTNRGPRGRSTRGRGQRTASRIAVVPLAPRVTRSMGVGSNATPESATTEGQTTEGPTTVTPENASNEGSRTRGRGRMGRGQRVRGRREPVPIGFGVYSSPEGETTINTASRLPIPLQARVTRSMGDGIHISLPIGRKYFHAPQERRAVQRKISSSSSRKESCTKQ